MVLYKVEISPNALSQLDQYVNYIHYRFRNEDAADAVLIDAYDTIDELAKSAGSLEYCKDPLLRQLGYRKIFFCRHDYVMIYDIDDNHARVKAIYHTLQDYEQHFVNQI